LKTKHPRNGMGPLQLTRPLQRYNDNERRAELWPNDNTHPFIIVTSGGDAAFLLWNWQISVRSTDQGLVWSSSYQAELAVQCNGGLRVDAYLAVNGIPQSYYVGVPYSDDAYDGPLHVWWNAPCGDASSSMTVPLGLPNDRLGDTSSVTGVAPDVFQMLGCGDRVEGRDSEARELKKAFAGDSLVITPGCSFQSRTLTLAQTFKR
jgi:hypothetical protein